MPVRALVLLEVAVEPRSDSASVRSLYPCSRWRVCSCRLKRGGLCSACAVSVLVPTPCSSPRTPQPPPVWVVQALWGEEAARPTVAVPDPDPQSYILALAVALVAVLAGPDPQPPPEDSGGGALAVALVAALAGPDPQPLPEGSGGGALQVCLLVLGANRYSGYCCLVRFTTDPQPKQ